MGKFTGTSGQRSGRAWVRLATSLVLLLVALARPLLAQSEAPPERAGNRTIRLEEMRQMVEPFRLESLGGDRPGPAVLRREPIARWNDPTREFSDGSLWLWTRAGRPVAAVAVELYPQYPRGPTWAYEFVSLSTGRLELGGGEGFDEASPDLPPPTPDGSVRWAPKGPGLTFFDLPGGAAPGPEEAERLRQMKGLATRFSATESYNNQTYTLRLLPHPAYRYSDEAEGIVDGTMFFFATGTNPEVLLALQARRRGAGPPAWQFAAAPLGRALLSLSLDRREVWNFPVKAVAARDDTYFIARKLRVSPSGSSDTKRSPGDSP